MARQGRWSWLLPGVLAGAALLACHREATRHEQEPFRFNLTLPSGTLLPATTVAASGGVRLGDRACASGTVASATGIVELGKGACAGSVAAGGGVTLGPGAKIDGDVVARGAVAIGSDATVSGKVTQSSISTTPYPISWSIGDPSRSQGPILLQDHGNGAPSPGVYDDVTVEKGATLYLRTGRYFLSGLDVEADASLVVDSRHGPVAVYVSSGFTFLGREQGADSGLPQLFVGYVGTNRAIVKTPFAGTLLAPNAEILVGGREGALHHAAFYGQEVVVDAGQIIKPTLFDWFEIPGVPPPVLRLFRP